MAVDIYPILATICQKCEKFKARLNMLEQSISGDIYHWLCHIVVVVIVEVVVMMVVVMVMMMILDKKMAHQDYFTQTHMHTSTCRTILSSLKSLVISL